ncbi:MAG: hypothetical protein GDA52_04290 [Rhodobacteraceae bacterium]|nr:hypothetical protein [Paracoccaceae bacterium]
MDQETCRLLLANHAMIADSWLALNDQTDQPESMKLLLAIKHLADGTKEKELAELFELHCK